MASSITNENQKHHNIKINRKWPPKYSEGHYFLSCHQIYNILITNKLKYYSL